jgi:hypothetical protein
VTVPPLVKGSLKMAARAFATLMFATLCSVAFAADIVGGTWDLKGSL